MRPPNVTQGCYVCAEEIRFIIAMITQFQKEPCSWNSYLCETQKTCGPRRLSESACFESQTNSDTLEGRLSLRKE